MIFADYLGGIGRNGIYRKMVELDVPAKAGWGWCEASIDEILRNEANAVVVWGIATWHKVR